jgi:hypothetical protein
MCKNASDMRRRWIAKMIVAIAAIIISCIEIQSHGHAWVVIGFNSVISICPANGV